MWQWKNVVTLSEPKPYIRSAFRVVINNNWQGIAYLMLEVAGLDFIEAIQVSYFSCANVAGKKAVNVLASDDGVNTLCSCHLFI